MLGEEIKMADGCAAKHEEDVIISNPFISDEALGLTSVFADPYPRSTRPTVPVLIMGRGFPARCYFQRLLFGGQPQCFDMYNK